MKTKNVLLLAVLLLVISLKAQAITFIEDFEWLEKDNQIEIAVGEPHQLQFTCKAFRDKVFSEEYKSAWIHYDFTPMQHIVDEPTGYAIDKRGVITGLVPGKYAIKYVSPIHAKSGTDKWLMITVVSEHREKESNDTFETANEIKTKIRFGLYNISDKDFFRFTHQLSPTDLVGFKIHFYGNRELPLGYKWAMFSEDMMSGSGSIISQDQMITKPVWKGNNIYLEVYFDQSLSNYFEYGEEFVVEVYVNGVQVKIEIEEEAEPESQEKNYVDLGLPSGNLWAKTNIGAHQENETGNRYSFGETQIKTYYMEEQYKWYDQTTGQYTKYVSSGNYADYKTELEREDDAATQNWGEHWHTPSVEDIEELCRYCSSRWEEVNGTYGRRFTASNGNSIFLPAGGFEYSYNQYYNELGYYMTTHVVADDKCQLFYFSSSEVYTTWRNIKCEGYSVRPVTNFDPTKKYYSLTIQSTGNGNVLLRGTNVHDETKSFNINEGTNATISFSPDNGYRIKSVKVNGSTIAVSNNQYTISNISRNTTVEVEFEAITYTLTIESTGNGSASYNGTTIRGSTSSFTVNEGSAATIRFNPDNGYMIKSVKVNGSTVAVSSDQYTVSNVSRNTTVNVEFEANITELAVDGVNYKVASLDDKMVNVASGNYGEVLRVPATVNNEGLTFKVAGIESGALASATNLAAVIWEPAAKFTENVSNPNLLLYVRRADYAPAGIQNVVVNGTAEQIVLTEARNGNDFYCPKEFTARFISLTHHYSMISGLESCQGWETIALPFDVQWISHESKGTMVPFAAWQQADEAKPFWLYELGSNGWMQATAIKANTPYLISMPNNAKYRDAYRLNGNVIFSAWDVKVKNTEEATAVSGGGKTLVPNFRSQSASSEVFALNVVNDYNSETAGAAAGSQFVRQLRPVHPFEAYLIANNMTRGDVIPVFEEYNTTDVVDNEIMRYVENENWYSVDGRKLEGKPTRKGVYIKNGRKVVIK